MGNAARHGLREATRPRDRALRVGLPYGAVMATGASSQLAGMCSLPGLVRPLLWLAVAEAVVIAGMGAIRHRRELRRSPESWAHLGPPGEHVGILTVPIGLAVIATGMAPQPGPTALGLARVATGLALAATIVFVGRLVASTLGCRPGIRIVDGGWFLAPAALLATAIAAAALVPRSAGAAQATLRWLALAGAVLGAGGYLAVVVLAALRLRRARLAGAPRVLWWISAGCGGLAAASIARVLAVRTAAWGPALTAGLRDATTVAWVMATALIVPIAVESARFLLKRHQVARAAPWPPTFSTAVYALGALGAGKLHHLQVLTTVGKAAGIATLILWALTTALHASRLLPAPHPPAPL